MIDLVTSTLCKDCFALKTALAYSKIDYRELNIIKDLTDEEKGDLEDQAKNRMLAIRYDGGTASMESIMVTPIIRLYSKGIPAFLFPIDTLDHGVCRKEAIEGIRAMIG